VASRPALCGLSHGTIDTMVGSGAEAPDFDSLSAACYGKINIMFDPEGVGTVAD